jgi:hypothetical protein
VARLIRGGAEWWHALIEVVRSGTPYLRRYGVARLIRGGAEWHAPTPLHSCHALQVAMLLLALVREHQTKKNASTK